MQQTSEAFFVGTNMACWPHSSHFSWYSGKASKLHCTQRTTNYNLQSPQTYLARTINRPPVCEGDRIGNRPHFTIAPLHCWQNVCSKANPWSNQTGSNPAWQTFKANPSTSIRSRNVIILGRWYWLQFKHFQSLSEFLRNRVWWEVCTWRKWWRSARVCFIQHRTKNKSNNCTWRA